MATYTSFLHLEKPTTSERLDVLKINANWDAIDSGVSALNSQKVNKYRHNISGASVITTTHISEAITACSTAGYKGTVAIEFYRTDQNIVTGTLWFNMTSGTYGAGILTSYYNDYLQSVFDVNGTITMKRIALVD